MSKLYVITNPVPIHNNSPLISLGKFLQIIRRAGSEPTVIGARIPEDGIPGVGDTVSVINYSYGGRGILKLASYILLQLRTFFSGLVRFRKGDAVYFWIADKMIGAFLAAKLRGAENNFFLYGKISSRHTQNWARNLEQYMTDCSDCVCAEAKSVLTECRIPEDRRTDVIQLFVPETEIEPPPYAERGNLVSVMSRLSPEKYPLETIRAVAEVHRSVPDIRLRIIGGGPIEDECRQLVCELGAEDYIEFTGWLPPDEAKQMLGQCRILMYPAEIEGVPGGILEAMSFGIPALASPVGGIPDLIDNGKDGVFLSATDADTIAAELTELLNSGKLEAMSAAAINKIKERFTLERAAQNFAAVRASHNTNER